MNRWRVVFHPYLTSDIISDVYMDGTEEDTKETIRRKFVELYPLWGFVRAERALG